MIEDNFELSWWPIFGFDNHDWQNRKFSKLEREGKFGFCVADYSPFENKKITTWLQEHCQDFSYMSQNEECDHYHSLIGAFDSLSRCIWVNKERAPDLHEFMQSLPKRLHVFPCGKIDPIVKRMLRGINYRVIEGLKDDPERFPHKNVISVAEHDNTEHLTFLLAITR